MFRNYNNSKMNSLLCFENDLIFLETSAKTSENVEEVAYFF